MNEALRDWIATVARHVLRHRLGRRAASVSADGARLPVGDRPARRAARSCDADGPPARRADRLRRRRQQRDRPLPSVPRRPRASTLIGVEAAGHGLETRRARGVAHGRAGRRAARQQDLSAAGRDRADPQTRTRSPPGSTIPASAPSTLAPRQRARDRTSPSPTTRRSRRCALLAETEGIIPALESAHAIAHVIRAGADADAARRSCS